MHTFILAGGLGTRLRPYTHTIPKPLMPLGERSILDILLHKLGASGVTHVTLSLGYLAPILSAFVRDGSEWGLRIETVEEKEPLGTAGPMLLAGNLPENFLLVNGDTLTDLDFAALMESHVANAAEITIFAPKVEMKVDYGVLVSDPDTGALTDYVEKPVHELLVSSGVYALSREALRFIPQGRRFDMPDLVRAALAAQSLVQVHRSDAYWRDIGRMDHYEAAIEDFARDPDRFLK